MRFNRKLFTDGNEIPCMVVLGMHRSGTSSLAGCLQKMGLYLGDVYESNPHNSKGNRENQRVRDLNDQVLACNKAGWDYPPSHWQRLSWTDEQAAARDELIRNMQTEAKANGATYWGFKDPRTLVTWPFWKHSLPQLCLVGTFRHPVAVAASLQKRDGMQPEKAYKLWCAYNQRLLKICRSRPFRLFDFDSSASLYRRALVAFAEEHAMDPAGADFFEEELRSTRFGKDEHSLPWHVKRLYHKLQKQCVRDEGGF